MLLLFFNLQDERSRETINADIKDTLYVTCTLTRMDFITDRTLCFVIKNNLRHRLLGTSHMLENSHL
jgi:hypothetical protein